MTARKKPQRHRIKINRAPVLTLWAAVVAQRLGFDWKAALTLGRAVAGLNAYSKGRALGIFHPAPRNSRRREKSSGPGSACGCTCWDGRCRWCGQAAGCVRQRRAVPLHRKVCEAISRASSEKRTHPPAVPWPRSRARANRRSSLRLLMGPTPDSVPPFRPAGQVGAHRGRWTFSGFAGWRVEAVTGKAGIASGAKLPKG